ncbi:MAG: hypothetical protein L6R42_004611 [Xanthoria sp. 1 TBL-2021]|nr:MAG: hypothetical protein L6R42_004611 [Xanthoria sp. 1 TBL-2021]
MCKHILNAQVAIRSPWKGRKWFDCAECHAEQEDHPLLQQLDMTFACKKCKKCFRKDVANFEDCDEYCPHCDNHYILEAVTPTPALQVEGEDARIDARMLKDDRVRSAPERRIFDVKDAADRLG